MFDLVARRQIDTGGKIACGSQIVGPQERQFSRTRIRLGQNIRRGQETASRNCALIGHRPGDFALGKTGI